MRTVHEGTLTEVEEYTNRKFTWTTFSGLHRVTEHVAKVSILWDENLMLSMLDKDFSRGHLKILFLYFTENRH